MHSGRPALVVETEFIIALSIQTVLETRFSSTVVAFTRADDALAHSAEWSDAWLAIVELETGRPDLLELARRISQSGIPVIGITANVALMNGVPELPGTPILIKPIPDDQLADAVSERRRQYPLPDVT